MRETDEIENKIDLENFIAALPPQQGRAVRLYARGYSQVEIAHKFGVSDNAIWQCFRKIREKYTSLDRFC